MRIWDIITGRRHHYFVKFSYRSKQGRLLFESGVNLSIREQAEINKHRAIKKAMHHLIYRPKTKPYLCSGTVQIEQISYLGKFSSDIIQDSNLEKLGDILFAYMAVFHNKRKLTTNP